MAGKAKNEQKNPRKNYAGLALLCTAGLIAAALAIMVFSSLLLPNFDPILREPGPPRFGGRELFASNQDLSSGMESYFTIRLVLSLVNLGAIAYLLFIHVKDYLRLRSSFTLGLITFLFSFFLYALSTLPVLHIFLGPYALAGMLSYVPMLFSAIGLLIFAKLSSE